MCQVQIIAYANLFRYLKLCLTGLYLCELILEWNTYGIHIKLEV